MLCCQALSKAFVDRADCQKLFIAMASRLFEPFLRRICACSGVSCSTVTDVSRTSVLSVILGLRFSARLLLILRRLQSGQVLFHVFDSSLATGTLRTTFRRLLKGHPVIPGLGTALQCFAFIVKRRYSIDRVFQSIGDTLLL